MPLILTKRSVNIVFSRACHRIPRSLILPLLLHPPLPGHPCLSFQQLQHRINDGDESRRRLTGSTRGCPREEVLLIDDLTPQREARRTKRR